MLFSSIQNVGCRRKKECVVVKAKNRKSTRGRKREKNTVDIWRNENGVGVRDSYKKQVFGMMEIRNLTRLANTALRDRHWCYSLRRI